MWATPKTATLDLTYIRFPKELIELQQPGTPGKEPPVAKPREQFLYSIPDVLKHCSDSGNGGAAADPQIAAKRVTLVGGDFIRGRDLLGAAAEIYGLPVARDGGKVLLTIPQATQKPMIAFITRSPSGTARSTWGSTMFRIFESDPAFSLVNSQLGPPKPRRSP